ncbi:MAG: DUF1189 family protein [Candidatus Liptonbacteria bacterium]|nr:DUF1189 family protein [Candidatus Liptonbacteria bacterium]
MNLLAYIGRSVYSPPFYREILGERFAFSLKYFCLLAVTLAVVVTALLGFALVPFAQTILKTAGPEILERFPDELVITVADGMVSVNVVEPFRIALDDELRAAFVGADKPAPAHILVIDTESAFTLEEFADRFAAYDTLLLLTKNAVVFGAPGEEPDVEILRRSMSGTLTKQKVSAFLEAVRPFVRWSGPLLVFGIFVIAVLAYGAYLLLLLPAALFVWLLAGKMRLGYKKSYQVGLHALTLGLLLQTVGFLFGLPVPFFVFAAAFLAAAYVNLKPWASRRSGDGAGGKGDLSARSLPPHLK